MTEPADVVKNLEEVLTGIKAGDVTTFAFVAINGRTQEFCSGQSGERLMLVGMLDTQLQLFRATIMRSMEPKP